jgi:E3 Ubiquitin ligase
MGLVIGGAVCLVLGAVAFFVWRSQQKSLNAMLLTDTLTCGELGELSRAAADAVGAGSFSQACEVVGVAAPGDQGVLTAPESGREVVWHRSEAIEHYWETERDSDGDERRVERTRVVASHVSQAPFVVRDATGEIVVEVAGADVDNAPVIANTYERDLSKVEIGSGLLANIAEAFLQKDKTIGIERKEWGIAPGQRLYVLAEASDRGGRLAMVKPAEGKFMISTRTEEELRASKRGFANVARVLAIAFGALGAALVAAGVLTLVL